MLRNKPLLTALLISLSLLSCPTSPEEPSSPADGVTRDGQDLSGDTAAAIPQGDEAAAEASIPSEPEAAAGRDGREDAAPVTEPEAASETEAALAGGEAVSEDAPAPVEPEAPVKEARRGGRKESVAEAEDAAGDSEEALSFEPVAEELPETPAVEPVRAAEAAAEELSPEEDAAAAVDPEAPSPEESLSEADSGPEDSPEEPEEEQEYSITVVNELSMGGDSGDLPSERDDIRYNPLLPVVVDAPPVSSGQEEVDPEAEGVESPDDPLGSLQPAAAEPASRQRASGSDGSGMREDEIDDEVADEGMREEEVAELDEAELDSITVDSTGKLIIELQGSGWIYMDSEGSEDFSLKDKSYNPDKGTTRFVFTGSSSPGGEGRLVFLKQDLLRGESSRKSLSFEMPSGPASDPNEDEGAREEEPVPAVAEEPGREESGASESAEPSELREPAGDIAETGVPAAAAGSAELPRDAAGLLRLAERYESPGPDQSLEKALELYRRIKREFPVTEERFIAETRIRYLNKHYFKVQ
jgi:hypothetical protein